MNVEAVADHLRSLGYDAELRSEAAILQVRCCIGSDTLEFIHFFSDSPLTGIPIFFLEDAARFGQLAHVLVHEESGRGFVCLDDSDSISVNFEAPPLAYEASVKRHVNLLQPLITNPDFNTQELLREFHANWGYLCSQTLFVAVASEEAAELRIKKPQKDKHRGVRGHYIALGRDECREDDLKRLRESVAWNFRQECGLGLHLRLDSLAPPPQTPDDLETWFVDTISRITSADAESLDSYRTRDSKQHWLVFTSDIEDGSITFGIHLKSNKKHPVPITANELAPWQLTAINVRSLNAATLVPRGGASLSLADRSVLLVGCGSVGSELAHRLGAVGVGQITISDFDRFLEDNLYRHTLDVDAIDGPKGDQVVDQLQRKHPWVRASASKSRLLEWVQVLKEDSKAFDLVVVAIGSPTMERLFAYQLCASNVAVPVLNTWVEAFRYRWPRNSYGPGHARMSSMRLCRPRDSCPGARFESQLLGAQSAGHA